MRQTGSQFQLWHTVIQHSWVLTLSHKEKGGWAWKHQHNACLLPQFKSTHLQFLWYSGLCLKYPPCPLWDFFRPLYRPTGENHIEQLSYPNGLYLSYITLCIFTLDIKKRLYFWVLISFTNSLLIHALRSLMYCIFYPKLYLWGELARVSLSSRTVETLIFTHTWCHFPWWWWWHKPPDTRRLPFPLNIHLIISFSA